MRAITLKTAKKRRGTIARAKVRKVVAEVYRNNSVTGSNRTKVKSDKALVGKAMPVISFRVS